MDPQNILLVIIVVLAIILLILGVQAFLVLKDIKSTINKANKVLDETGVIAQNFSGVSLLANLVKSLISKKNDNPGEAKTVKSLEVRVNKSPSSKKPQRRFFRGTRR